MLKSPGIHFRAACDECFDDPGNFFFHKGAKPFSINTIMVIVLQVGRSSENKNSGGNHGRIFVIQADL